MSIETEERQLAIRHERDRFLAFAFASADILVEVDKAGSVVFADGATMGQLGFTPETMVGEEFRNFVLDEDKLKCSELFKELAKTPRMENIDLRLISETRGDVSFNMNAFRLKGAREHFYFALQSKRGDVEVEELLTRDVDSGLYKKNAFIKRATQMIRQTDNEDDKLKVSLLDFPELKEMLDMLPSDEADRLLREISEYLKEKSADGDTVGVMSESSYSFVHDSAVDAEQVAENILKITKKYQPDEGKESKFKVSTLDADVGNLSEADSANALLYTLNKCAQSQGDNLSVTSITEGYQVMLSDTLDRMRHFRETLQSTKFDLAFQPIVDLKDGHIHHFETLVRIQDNSVFSNPFEFINFGEKAGIIGEFDLLMVQRAMEVLKAASLKRNTPNISVNISGRSLDSNLFRDSLTRLLEEYPHRRKQVVFEVTESAKIGDLGAVNDYLQELRTAGNQISLDDFGTGESSFEYLRRLQVDYVKIDGSYVRESLGSQRGRLLLKAMANMCKELGVTTIGEMVEDEKNASMLWECGVRFGQGYLFGKPSVDEETLENCNKPTPFYGGAMKVRKFTNPDEEPKSWDDL